MHRTLKKTLLDRASAPYRATGLNHYFWARGKLNGDPFFATLADARLIPDGARVFDIGCGRGLLAAWLFAAEQLWVQGRWAEATPRPPERLSFYGIELVEREIRCGNEALHPLYGDRVQLVAGDMRGTDFTGADVVAILDVLHYVPHADQEQLLDRICAALPADGVFITRVGDAEGGLRFRLSQIVDRGMAFWQGHRIERMWCRPLPQWVQTLEARGFTVSTRPMSQGTPFANVMIVARRCGARTGAPIIP